MLTDLNPFAYLFLTPSGTQEIHDTHHGNPWHTDFNSAVCMELDRVHDEG